VARLHAVVPYKLFCVSWGPNHSRVKGQRDQSVDSFRADHVLAAKGTTQSSANRSAVQVLECVHDRVDTF
jgi:hypothetical protein